MSSFLQSREWASIQNRDGREAHQLVFGDESLLYFTHSLPLGFQYLYAPRPFIADATSFFSAVQELSKNTKSIFLKIEPEDQIKILAPGFEIRGAPNLQPEETIITDLLKADDELLSLMHPKTRYNIKLAEKHGVTIEKRVGQDAIDDFYGLLKKTAGRDKFHLHPKRHYENLLQSNSHEFSNELFLAFYKSQPAAAALVNFYGDTAAYLHGASNYELRNVMAPYLLHWQIMREARGRGMKKYDFWGTDAQRWPGVTRFKQGFGGEEKRYPKAFDIIFHPIPYMLYKVARRAHRL